MNTTRDLYCCRVIDVCGVVQGVGFRPFVFNLAKELGILGSVKNQSGAVRIVAQAPAPILDEFVARIRSQHPPLAKIADLVDTPHEAIESADFVILESDSSANPVLRMVPPDTAPCADCWREMNDPKDRRFRYPFINCTNCGPRYTIIKSLPYDRAATTMSAFPMCTECSAEYTDPGNRRFHAQPNGCWNCGPLISFYSIEEQAINLAEIEAAATILREGKILALKGLGGFHLACDPTAEEAVRRLRSRKRRYGKPFAVMFPSIESTLASCEISPTEMDSLNSNRRPIVLCNLKKSHQISPLVFGETGRLGVMLPYTPLHHELLRAFGGPLVMTSGNVTEEPICISNPEAKEKLANIADAFLFHNRDIETRFDDSVVLEIAECMRFIRRSRSFAPEPIQLGSAKARKTILGFGGHLKNTFCFAKSNLGYMSQHIGDLSTVDVVETFEDTLQKMSRLFDVQPQILACDLHPDYATTHLAEEMSEKLQLPLFRVQHHHAHIAACMAEHELPGPVLGIALDGTGYGTDGNSWGGEIMIANYAEFRREACLSPGLLPGGDSAAKNPWKMLMAYLPTIEQRERALAQHVRESLSKRVDQASIDVVQQQLSSRLNCAITTSCGRLFDAVASLLELCDFSAFEGDAAMRLEAAAWRFVRTNKSSIATQQNWVNKTGALYPLQTEVFRENSELQLVLDTPGLLMEIAAHNVARRSTDELAFVFHESLATSFADVCARLSEQNKIKDVCLSGGVFQNKLLTELVVQKLKQLELNAYLHVKVPANDGGISLGQCMVAAAKAGELER